MTQRFNKAFLVFLTILFVLAGCSQTTTTPSAGDESGSEGQQGPPQPAQQGEKVLYYQIPGEITKFDPHVGVSLQDFTMSSQIWNSLVRFPNGTIDVTRIEGDLAEKWEHNEDATEWTFYLRKGVQWHRGYGEFTAEDVKFSFERVLDPATGSSTRVDYEHIEEIEIIDPYTVKFHLSRPDPNFLLGLVNAGTGAWIVSKKAVEEGKTEIGTGPFMFEDYRSKDGATLVKNPDYFRGEPKLDKIVYKIITDPTAIEVALTKGELHFARMSGDPLIWEKYQQNDAFIVEKVSPLIAYGLYLNMDAEPLNDIRVRQAIAHAIDVETFVESYAKGIGQPMTSAIASDVFGAADVGMYEYDPEKAKQLLKEAGYENGLQFPTQFTSAAKHILDKMLYVQDQLRQVGIEVPLEQVDHSVYQANIRNDLNHLVLFAYNRLPHADKVLSSVFYGPATVGTPTGSINFSHYNRSDDLIDAARVETDPEKAKEMYRQILQDIKDAYAFVPLVEQYSINIRRKEVHVGYNNNKVEGTMLYNMIIDETTDLIQ